MGPTSETNPSASFTKGYQVSKLAADSSNWSLWKRQMLTMLSVHKGVKQHLDGLARLPPTTPQYPDGYTLTSDEEEALKETEHRQDEYEQRENIIKAQILTSVPESITLEIQDKDKVFMMWSKLCAKHEDKALVVHIDLRGYVVGNDL